MIKTIVTDHLKVFKALPGSNASDGNFGNQDMNMRIPLEAASKGMKNANETGSKMLSFIELTKHMKNDVANRMKKAVEQRTISAKEDTEFFRNGKDAMTVNGLDELEGHRSSALDRVEISTGRTKAALAAKRNKFERTTRSTPVHGAAERRITAMNHFIDVFHNDGRSFEGVLDFFKVI